MASTENEVEDPDFWCDKSPSRGKNKGKHCGGNLRHKGKCGPWFLDEERQQPDDPEAVTDGQEDAEVVPLFAQPAEGTVAAEVVGPEQTADFLPAEESTAADVIEFKQPHQAPIFEEPDLRGKDGYQHPVTGEKVPGVTSISGLLDKSGYLTPWSARLAAEWVAPNVELLATLPDNDTRVAVIKQHAEKLRHAGRDTGSLAHNTIEAILRGEDVQIHPSVQPQVDGFREWQDRFVQQIVLSEATVWSDAHKYGGTMDLAVVLKDGRLVCVDIKTGKDVHEDAALQLTALVRAEFIVSPAGQVANLPFAGGGVLHLPQPVKTATGKDSVRGKWSYRPIECRDVEWATFINLRAAWEWEHTWSRSAIGGKQTMLPGVTA